jgi:hypothetical protein
LHEFGDKTWAKFLFSLKVAILNQDVFSLNMTELTQPLPECLNPRPGSFGIAKPHISDPRDILRLLRPGERSSCQQDSCQ